MYILGCAIICVLCSSNEAIRRRRDKEVSIVYTLRNSTRLPLQTIILNMTTTKYS